MPILALDLGTVTGWAVEGASGYQDLSPQSYYRCDQCGTTKNAGRQGTKCDCGGVWERTAQPWGTRFSVFHTLLTQLIKQYQITAIVYEEVLFNPKQGYLAPQMWGGFFAVMHLVATDHNIFYDGVPVKTLKKFWTGSGNSDKDVMVTTAQKRGYNIIDHNEADAIALLYYATESR